MPCMDPVIIEPTDTSFSITSNFHDPILDYHVSFKIPSDCQPVYWALQSDVSASGPFIGRLLFFVTSGAYFHEGVFSPTEVSPATWAINGGFSLPSNDPVLLAVGRTVTFDLQLINEGGNYFFSNFTLSVCCGSPGDRDPYNYVCQLRQYHRVASGGGVVHYSSSLLGNPAYGFDKMQMVVGNGRRPKITRDKNTLLRVVCDDGTNTLEYVSGDDGNTWSLNPMSYFEKGTHPTIESSILKRLLRGVFVADDSDPSNGTIHMCVQEPGEDQPGEEFSVRDDQGNLIKFREGNFHITEVPDGSGVILLTAVASGDSAPSEWQSGDDTRTFKKVT